MSEELTSAQELIELNWKAAAKKHGADFGEHTQAALKKEWAACTEAPYFQLCLKNAVALNPVLNRSAAVRRVICEWNY